jgi:hypothetical protein
MFECIKYSCEDATMADLVKSGKAPWREVLLVKAKTWSAWDLRGGMVM